MAFYGMIRKVETGFRKGSCSNKKLSNGSDSAQSDQTLARRDQLAEAVSLVSLLSLAGSPLVRTPEII